LKQASQGFPCPSCGCEGHSSRDRLNTRLPAELWRALRRLAARWGVTPDQAVRRCLHEADVAPGEAISPKPSTGSRGGLLGS